MHRPSIATEELIDLITRHQVIEAERLWSYLAEKGGPAGMPSSAAELVEDLVHDRLLTAYQGDKLLAGEVAWLVIGKYHLIDRLGPPDSTVYLAERCPGRQKVAIKVLTRESGTPRAVVERFHREAEALARLDHPNIVAIKDSGQDNGRLFLVTEYIDGKSLTEMVEQQGPMAPALAVRVIHSALEALEHIHEIGLVHRNLEPGHLVLDQAGKVHLVDLGLARFLDEPGAALTLLGGTAPLGSVEFQAPEQIRNSHDVDIRADVYALGATLYYLLTGKPPFSQHALLRLAAGVLTHPQPLSQLRPDLPRGLVTTIETMMAARREERYQTPTEAKAALDVWLQQMAPEPLRVKRTSAQVPTVKVAREQDLPSAGARQGEEANVPTWLVAVVVFALSAAVFLAALWLWKGE